MSNIIITYLGHSCFKVEKDGYSIVFDPYQKGSVPGVELPDDLEADRVICSHGHGDHNAAERVRIVEHAAPSMTAEFIEVPHDDADGAKRGMNSIAVVKAGDAELVHFGDIGRLPTEEEYAALEGADVIMIPTGGFFTIDAAQAAEIRNRLQPSMTILMHFRKGDAGYEVLASIDEVKAAFNGAEEVGKSVEFAENSIPEAVIVMNP